MISLISSLSYKLYLNSLVYHRNIFGSSLKVFGNLWKSSNIFETEIFRNFWKIFGNGRLPFRTILENLLKSSERGQISSDNYQKRHHQYIYIIKRALHVSSKIWTLCSREILFLLLEHKIHIFSPPCNILYVYNLTCSGWLFVHS